MTATSAEARLTEAQIEHAKQLAEDCRKAGYGPIADALNALLSELEQCRAELAAAMRLNGEIIDLLEPAERWDNE